MLNITKFNNNSFFENTYVFTNQGIQVIVDPGLNWIDLEKNVDFKKKTIILLTHFHFDHTYSTEYLCEKYDLKAYLNIKDKDLYKSSDELKHDQRFLGFQIPLLPPLSGSGKENIIFFEDKIDEFPSLKIINAPGHSHGSTLFIFNKDAFVGDVLFYNTIGRYDLPGSSHEETLSTIELLKSLDSDLTIHSGHGQEAKLSEIKKINPYLK